MDDDIEANYTSCTERDGDDYFVVMPKGAKKMDSVPTFVDAVAKMDKGGIGWLSAVVRLRADVEEATNHWWSFLCLESKEDFEVIVEERRSEDEIKGENGR